MTGRNLSNVDKFLHMFRRQTQYWGLKVAKIADPSKFYTEKQTDFYREAFGICHKLISNPSTTLLMSPISGKRYIKSDDSQIFIVINRDTIDIINHTYSYNIKVNGTNLYDKITRVFDNEVERRREVMEAEIKNNVEHSLKTIYNSLVNEKDV
jgi:hypothetical protein